MLFRMVYKSGPTFLPFCHKARVWQTDRQTDGQTEFSSLNRVCIACSAVKRCCCFFYFWLSVYNLLCTYLHGNEKKFCCTSRHTLQSSHIVGSLSGRRCSHLTQNCHQHSFHILALRVLWIRSTHLLARFSRDNRQRETMVLERCVIISFSNNAIIKLWNNGLIWSQWCILYFVQFSYNARWHYITRTSVFIHRSAICQLY